MQPLSRQSGPKDSIIDLLQSLPDIDREGGNVTEKMEQISSLIGKNPTFKSDGALMDRIFTTINTLQDEAIQEKCRTILLEKPATVLKVSEYDLDDIWGKIEREGIEKLIIEQKDGEPIVYEKRVLRQLLEKRPPVEALTGMYTIKFEEGEPLQETKAHLLLCGEMIKGVLSQGMKEAQLKTIYLNEVTIPFVIKDGKMISLQKIEKKELKKFKETNKINEILLSRDVFDDVIQEMKTGERGMEDDVYQIVCDNLQYTKWIGIPEGAIGPEQWKSVAIEVKEVPALPADIDQILKSDCPYCEGKKVHETHKLMLMPKGLSIKKLGELMRHLRKGDHETVFRSFHGVGEDKNTEEIKESYWVLVTTEVIPDSRNKSLTDQVGLIEKDKAYKLPTVLEAIALVTMDKVCSKEREGYLLPKEPRYTLTRCEDKDGDGDPLVVGAFASSGLAVSRDYFGYDSIGVLALRKFS